MRIINNQQQSKELCNIAKTTVNNMTSLTTNRTVTIPGAVLSVGNSIHIHRFKGIYEIASLTDTHMTITCQKWRTLHNSWKDVKGNGGYKEFVTLPLHEFKAFHNEWKGHMSFMNKPQST